MEIHHQLASAGLDDALVNSSMSCAHQLWLLGHRQPCCRRLSGSLCPPFPLTGQSAVRSTRCDEEIRIEPRIAPRAGRGGWWRLVLYGLAWPRLRLVRDEGAGRARNGTIGHQGHIWEWSRRLSISPARFASGEPRSAALRPYPRPPVASARRPAGLPRAQSEAREPRAESRHRPPGPPLRVVPAAIDISGSQLVQRAPERRAATLFASASRIRASASCSSGRTRCEARDVRGIGCFAVFSGILIDQWGVCQPSVYKTSLHAANIQLVQN